MDGHTFVSKLKCLNIPGVENLKSNDFDWVYLESSDESLSLFWNWFFINVKKDDILSEEELEKYEELLSSGSVLSENHLKQIENCLENVSADDDLPLLSCLLEEGLQDDLIIYEKKFKTLTKKKDLLSMQNMEAEVALNNKRKCSEKLRHELESQTMQVYHICNEYSKAIEETSKAIQAVVIPFQSFKSNVDKAKFVTQIPNDFWSKQEKVYLEMVFKYIHKQFQEGIESIVNQDDGSQYWLLDSSQLDMQFIRGPKQVEYMRNVQDLNRINALLEETELNILECELEQACKNAEINEAIKFQRNLFSQSSPYSSLPLVKQQLLSLKEIEKALEQDFHFQKESLKKVCSFVSKTEGFRVISGNYEMKIKRQEYILSKQLVVREFLLGQISRLDLMKIICDIEKQKICTIFDIIINLNKTLISHYEGSSERLKLLNKLKELYLKDGFGKKEKNTLQALLCCEEAAYSQMAKSIVKNVKKLNISLLTSWNEMQSMSDVKTNVLEKLFKSCSVLEEILFEKNNSISNLPEVWTNRELLHHQAEVEEAMWQLQQEMFQVLKTFEKKKKILEDTQSIREDVIQWTKD